MDFTADAEVFTAAGVQVASSSGRAVFGYARHWGWELPQLVLAADVRLLRSSQKGGAATRMKPGRDWFTVAHQHSGLACHQRYMIATPLTVRPQWRAGVAAVAAGSHCCRGALGSVALTDLVAYRDLVDRHLPGQVVDQSVHDYREAVYPLDYTSAIADLVEDDLPESLDNLVDWSGPMAAFIGSLGRWSVLILGDNCD